MKKLQAITTVYSYYFPEVRAIINKVVKKYPHNIFLKSIQKPGLDNFHVPIIKKFINFQKNALPNLYKFTYQYPTAGAEEGIREIMTMLQSKGVKQIYVLKGEYEGYQAIADTRNIKTITVEENSNFKKLKPGYWFISNPSARNGNIIPNELIKELCQAGHKIVYDLTYLDTVPFYKFYISHPNIIAVLVSFSKPYGLFYYRTGFTFSRQSVPSLYGNKWFKNILSLIITDKIFNDLKPLTLVKKYKAIQKFIIYNINKSFNLSMRCSDSLLLGYIDPDDAKKLNKEQLSLISKYKRGDYYRFCLTPYYQELENK